MLKIDKLRLQLPAGYQHRSSDIARLIAEHLAGAEGLSTLDLKRLHVKKIIVTPVAGNQEIAHKVANSVIQGIRDQS